MDETVKRRFAEIEEQLREVERKAVETAAGVSLTLLMLVDLLAEKGLWTRAEVIAQLQRLRPDPAVPALGSVHLVREGLIELLSTPPRRPAGGGKVTSLTARLRERGPRGGR